MSTVAIGSIAAAGIGAAGSMIGSSEQAGAANNAADLQAQEAQDALNFQEQEFATQQANQKPWLTAGGTAIGDLSQLLGPGGSLSQQWTGQFQAPTLAEAEQYPGYQFQLQQGEQAVQNAASAQGELLDPNAARAEAGYAENLAQTDYGNVYNQALQQYQMSYNQFQQNQANQFNRLASVAGIGQTSAGQLGQTGQAAANNVGNIMLGSGAQIGQDIQNSAAATASGYTGAANSLGGAVNNIGTSLALQSLLQPSSNVTSGIDLNSVPNIPLTPSELGLPA